MAIVDVTIRGAGIFGLSIAWACVNRGARVRVVDPNGPAAGASGGIVGALAPHVPENWNPKKQFQLESLIMAERFWSDVKKAGGQDPGYARLGRVQPVADDNSLELAQTRAKNAEHLWQGFAHWTVCSDPDPHWHIPGSAGYTIFDTLSARIHPRKACLALTAALTKKNVAIETDGPDQGLVIHATGVPGLTTLNAQNGRAVGAGIKGQAALFALSMPDAPQLFIDGLHVVPHADGTTAVGSTTERDYSDAAATDELLETLIAQAREKVPLLRDAPVLARWAGLRPRSRSRAPMLGPWPERHGHYIANGGFKIGFGMAPKVGEVMADLVIDGIDTIPRGFEVSASL